jgi:uncharacterized protein (DUF1697 family)
VARQIALLRGINVGGRKKVPMARLRELMAELGYEDVRTYVQSGNVVFTGPEASPDTVARRLEQALEEAFGFDVAVVVRSRDELAAVVRTDPLGDRATDPAKYLVSFLADAVDADRLADLDADEFAPEAFRLEGRELYLWLPDGVHSSRLAKALSDERLGTTATARNWRTVEKLLALADEG